MLRTGLLCETYEQVSPVIEYPNNSLLKKIENAQSNKRPR